MDVAAAGLILDDRPAPTLSIRAARASDVAELVRVLVSSRREFLSYAPLAHDDDDIARWMDGLLRREEGVTIACMDGQALGILVLFSGPEAGWIEQLYLAPGHTGKGIGSRLLAHALQALPGILPVRLYTFQANTGARRFYERHGFKAIVFGDGTGNEERCADVLYEREPSSR